MAIDMTSFNSMLKEHYSDVRVENMAYRKNPALGMVKKKTNAEGRLTAQPVHVSNPQGGSSDIATAIANATSSVYKDFSLTRVKNYVIANLDNETILASKGKDAFESAMKEIDHALSAASNRLAKQLFRDEGGSLGVIDASTTIGSPVLVFVDKGNVLSFEIGQTLKLGPNSAGTSLRTGTLVVAGVNRSAGTITLSGNITAGVAAASTGDFVFVEGDATATLSGFAAWLPAVAPTGGDNFFGVDRSVDSYLYGHIVDATSMSIEDAALQMGGDLQALAGSPDYLYMNPSKVTELSQALGLKREYQKVDTQGKAIVGFGGFQFDCGEGPVTVVGDRNCPSDRGYMLTQKDWTLWSAGGAPHILDRDAPMLRNQNADSYQARIGSYAQLGCAAPGHSGVILF